MRVTLRPPDPVAALPPLSREQSFAASWASGNLLVVGPPGSGKTVTALAALRRDSDATLLVPTRVGASRARESASAWAPPNRPLAIHTPSALAFSVLRVFAVARGEPSPTLLTGAEQDEILAELLAGHAEGLGAAVPWPPDLPREVLAIPAFRNELRDIMARAAEFGLDGADLRDRGRVERSPEWELAGALYEEYLNVVALGDLPATRGERFDAARIQAEAARVLDEWEGHTDAAVPHFGRIVVDDYQEITAAGVRLLHAVVARGADVTLFADPDTAVHTFRGARPSFVARADSDSGLGGFEATVVQLPEVYRGGAPLRDVVARASSQVMAIGGVARRKAPVTVANVTAPVGESPVRAVELRSQAAQAAFIAAELQSAHVDQALSWDQMAVIVRSDGMRDALVGELRRIDIPARPETRRFVLRDERAVIPLLLAVEMAAADEHSLRAKDAVSLLGSVVGGLDPVAMRRLRRFLRTRVNEGAFESLGAALLAIATQPEAARALPSEFRWSAMRVAQVVSAARVSLGRDHERPRAALWEAWAASDLAEHWLDLALAGGPRGERADDDLDAVIALMAAAESFEERLAGARASQFVRWVRELELPTDSLARTGQRREGVLVLTAAEAAGREWPVIVIAGVQEGQWPDPRLRDSLLASTALADAELGRLGVSRTHDRRREVLDDEWRLFVSAVSRSSRNVVVTAVRDDDSAPSVMFDSVAKQIGGAEFVSVVERLDLRGLVAALRSDLDTDPESDSAVLLAALAARGVAGSDPSSWAGVGDPSGISSLAVETVSPSRVELALRCPLRWALESSGGRESARIEATVGTLIHEIAAEFPHGTADELLAEVDRRFGELDLPEGWIARRELNTARGMMSLYASYVEGVPGEVETEVRVDMELGGVRIVGQVDRVERVDEGVRIVDLKTGARKSKAEVHDDMQLGTYQLAFGESTAGARIVYVKPETKSAAVYPQPALPEGGGEIREKFDRAVAAMRSGAFAPTPNPGCSNCPVRTSCPAMDEGARCSH